jgi:hypothetical protein
VTAKGASERHDSFDPTGLSVRLAHPREIGWMIHEHDLDKWPAVSTALIALCRDDRPVGCIVFAVPPRETIKRYGAETWELARLWVDDSEPHNTESWFIARAVKLVRRTCPKIRYLVSYADPSVGHVGTIYKASNWRYDGHTDAERKTPRFDYLCDGTHYSRRSHLPAGRPYERVSRVSEARYVLELKGGRSLRHDRSGVHGPTVSDGVAEPVYDPFEATPALILDGMRAA